MSFPGRAVQRCWHLVDASEQTVGRVAQQVAILLKGKHKPTFMPNKDIGDAIVIVNAEKVKFSGKKWDKKLYRWHTGYPGGLKERPAKAMLERNPTKILRKAILGQLTRNTLRQSFMRPRLKIYTGPTHPHLAQLPPGTEPLPKHPRKKSGKYHFGLKYYAVPGSYQPSLKKKPSPDQYEGIRVYEEIGSVDDLVQDLEDMEVQEK